MNELPESYDPLEQWKEDYNRDGTASVQVLSRLAHMSRFIAGYQERSSSRDPAGRSFADIADWAAYTYVGGTTAGAEPEGAWT
jgi:hypothetical protein